MNSTNDEHGFYAHAYLHVCLDVVFFQMYDTRFNQGLAVHCSSNESIPVFLGEHNTSLFGGVDVKGRETFVRDWSLTGL